MEYQYEYSDKIALPWVVKNLPTFLFPDLSRKQSRIRKTMVGVVASLDKQPVGLVLATFGNTVKSARIHSFKVHPDHRNKGIASQLLSTLEQNLKNAGCSRVDGSYRQHWNSVPALQKLLGKNEWSAPKEELIIVKGRAENVLKLFMERELELPEGFSFKPFAGLSEEHRSDIKRRKGEEDWYPDVLDPFLYGDSINPVTSLALMHGDDVVGWVMSHQVAPGLNEFTSLFIDKDVRSYKLAHLLMRETIYRQHDHGIPEFMITAQKENSVMSRFLMRHADETGVFFTRTYRTFKDL